MKQVIFYVFWGVNVHLFCLLVRSMCKKIDYTIVYMGGFDPTPPYTLRKSTTVL